MPSRLLRRRATATSPPRIAHVAPRILPRHFALRFTASHRSVGAQVLEFCASRDIATGPTGYIQVPCVVN